MALSQIQCLDDHHVNWRVSESKPEFFYSEDQRLALEALISSGRDAFTDYTSKHGVREFLSELELERIVHTAEAYRPGHEHHQKPELSGPAEEGADDGEVSLEYWPDRSEASVVELDLGWPDAISYRGVTRVTVHTQPPADGHTHIKEVVRKSIASAQKVIAVVMDAFTDVDIFRDLLDASYKRRIPVYIIIDPAAVPCFLSMCGRANMHRGHLKNLRVRCCGGVEFFSRSAQKVRGSLSQKYLLVDGDRAISGSYSFTWSSSRLDRNLITVITGQAVETFDVQFRDLYLMSRSVSLNKVPMEDEPAPDPVPQAAPTPVPASVARKLINPKYALVASGTSPTSSDQNSSNKNSNSQNPTGLKVMKGRLKDVVEEPPLHPGLANLEKAYLIPYLPTWPEPDPPSDVIGFINIRDEKRAHKVHLQRSERFEVSQAIRFSSPLAPQSHTEESTSSQPVAAAQKPKEQSESTTPEASSPKSLPNQPLGLHTAENKDSTDATDSPQTSHSAPVQETQQTNAHSSSSLPKVTPEAQTAADSVQQISQAQTAAPPVPKRRTLQLVIDPTSSEHPDNTQVTLVKMDHKESLKTASKTQTPSRLRLTSRDNDSGSNEEGSQDSTKVMCDRALNEDPSSASTASEEELSDRSQSQQHDPLTNGVQQGSSRGNHQGDGLNIMARFSQSMLDLREPSQSEDTASLIRESQQLRRMGHPSPHRHIGQLFQTSRSPGRDARLKGPKVIIAKPGSFHRPSRAAVPVIGGYRYWQGQTGQSDSSQLQVEGRSGRSPRRHSPGYKKAERISQEPNAEPPSGFFGMSLSKLGNFRNSRARGGAAQKKVSQNNKAVR
ncbi:hypothetical protein OJAV_G00004470 [Oryzias javanicus]|uniref:Scaffolding anchor of CK1 domain-containing protein n=1 Tax=Oryzias javanicus TaxID=123683 RepID=A0A3S2PHM0_ORYJA|nr:hypothetical protein OJAV_G00004470 [Oryzias javanicus]